MSRLDVTFRDLVELIIAVLRACRRYCERTRRDRRYTVPVLLSTVSSISKHALPPLFSLDVGPLNPATESGGAL